MSSSTFRADINGLRAWAVIAVLLFHFQVAGFDAGFIGVDIFFVISGFLMTGIIAKGLSNKNFSLGQFYMARFRRIIPAVVAIIAILFILAWFFLPTPDYQELAREAKYALSFISNIHLNKTAGYFDTEAHEKWLLHTWSLGVEMQFYIIYPVFAALIWKIKPSLRMLFYSLIAIVILSLSWSIVSSKLNPTAAFYLLPARSWELAAGGIIYFLSRNKTSIKLSKLYYLLGLTLCLTSFLIINNDLSWPSGWALLPVIGTSLIIFAAQEKTLLMGNPLAQWLGNISYSVYLWHWPLVVILHYADLLNNFYWVSAFFALSLILGHASYKLIETPTRTILGKLELKNQLIVFAITIAIMSLFISIIRNGDYKGRLPESVELAAAEAQNIDPRLKECEAKKDNTSPGCTYGKNNIQAIVIGDSHAMYTVTAIGEAAQKYNSGIIFHGKAACPTLDNVININRKGVASDGCSIFNKWVLENNKKTPEIPLISISRTSSYLVGGNEPAEAKNIEKLTIHFGKQYKSRFDPDYILEFQNTLISTACRIAKERPMYLMRPIPEFGTSIPKDLARNMMLRKNYDDIKITLEEYHQRNNLVWEAQDQAAKQCGVKILNPLPYLCDSIYCYGSKDGRPLYTDDDHLSEYGNKFLVPMFEEIFKTEQTTIAD